MKKIEGECSWTVSPLAPFPISRMSCLLTLPLPRNYLSKKEILKLHSFFLLDGLMVFVGHFKELPYGEVAIPISVMDFDRRTTCFCLIKRYDSRDISPSMPSIKQVNNVLYFSWKPFSWCSWKPNSN